MNDNLIKETISDNTTTTTKSIINGSSFLYKNIDVGQDKPLNVVETLNSGDLATDVMFTDQELKAIEQFLRTQNWPADNAKYWNIAVKFLMARKFDLDRGLKLYQEHEVLRRKEGLDQINLTDEKFTRELESGKFTILPFHKNYPAYALFTVRLHSSTTSNELATLQSLIYQLDAVLEKPDVQRNGIVFIYDMNHCKKSNYDLNLSQKILMLVRGAYPARLNKILVVSAPFWFKCVVKVLSILLREKMRERVLFVTNDELQNQVPAHLIPDYLGGLHKLNHKSWLIECNKLINHKASTSSFYYFNSRSDSGITSEQVSSSSSSASSSSATVTDSSAASTTATTPSTNQQRKRSTPSDLEEKQPKKSSKAITSDKTTLDNFKNIEPLPFNDDINGMRIDELLEHVIKKSSHGLGEEFKSLKAFTFGSYEVFKKRENLYKNRYRDVICLDESRVRLKNNGNSDNLNSSNSSSSFDETSAGCSDYVHANYVDGYRQKNAYISTQGPLDETCEDFWRMVWQEQVLVIAMTTKVIEQRKIKCAQYWPLESGERMRLGDWLEIKNIEVEDLDDYRVSKLSLRCNLTQETRVVVHCQFTSWPDHGVPSTAAHILDFIDLVRKHQREGLGQLDWSGHPNGPPIIVHCSAGIGRTGTFCTIDICIQRLNDSQGVNLLETVQHIRNQRAQSVQTRDQYIFCYQAILEYAQRQRLFKDKQRGAINMAEIFDSILL